MEPELEQEVEVADRTIGKAVAALLQGSLSKIQLKLYML